MKVARKWSASSKPEGVVRGEDLASIAGQWGLSVEISITRPYSYSRGPIEERGTSGEAQKEEPSPD